MKEQKDTTKELSNDGKQDSKENTKPIIHSTQIFPKVSKIIFDEKTGTITLKLASKEEIAKAEEQEAKNTPE